jgi:hypothetical protein
MAEVVKKKYIEMRRDGGNFGPTMWVVTGIHKKKCVKCVSFAKKEVMKIFGHFDSLDLMFQGRLKKKKKQNTSTEIHKGVIFDRFLVSRRSQLDD